MLYAILGIIAVVIIVIILLFNKLATKRNQIENAISSTDALFIKRSDLIPNLIETVKKYVNFEKETLEKITSLRAMNGATDPKSEQEGKQALKGLMVQVENYPELKASQQFRDLQFSMNEVEEQISAGRRYISASITDYNNLIVSFPSNIIAGIFGFKKHEWQYASKTQRESLNAKELFKD